MKFHHTINKEISISIWDDDNLSIYMRKYKDLHANHYNYAKNKRKKGEERRTLTGRKKARKEEEKGEKEGRKMGERRERGNQVTEEEEEKREREEKEGTRAILMPCPLTKSHGAH